MTGFGKHAMMGAEGRCCINRRLATPLGKGVKLMGRKRWYAVLRFLVCLALWAYILTIKAC